MFLKRMKSESSKELMSYSINLIKRMSWLTKFKRREENNYEINEMVRI